MKLKGSECALLTNKTLEIVTEGYQFRWIYRHFKDNHWLFFSRVVDSWLLFS